MKYAWVAHGIARKLVTLNAVFVTFVFLDFGIIYAQNSATLGNINDKCTKATTHCIYISPHLNHTCLGNRLPYKLTSPHPIMPEISRYNLDVWTAMRAVPACWDKLQ
ncbi:unnamed protein product, partial [Dicrocoelium dendriticum]